MKPFTHIKNIGLLAGWLAAFAIKAPAQTSNNSGTDEADIVSSIAPYPAETRSALLDVAQYSQKIVKIERLQTRSSQSFQYLVQKYPRNLQENFYELSRYPALVSTLANNKGESAEVLTAGYPASVAAAAKNIYPYYVADLQSIDNANQQSEQSLQNLLAGLPLATQQNFRKVLARPELMELLTDRIDLTVNLGMAYQNDPTGVAHALDSLHNSLEVQNQYATEQYRQKVNSDPQLQQEIKKSAQDFATSYKVDTVYTTVVNNNYYYSNNVSPYSYWYGYPYWYGTAMWYPMPLQYYTGFYIGAGGNVIITGLPAYAYSNWFFSYGYAYYPRMYSYGRHFYYTAPPRAQTAPMYGPGQGRQQQGFARANHLPYNPNRGNYRANNQGSGNQPRNGSNMNAQGPNGGGRQGGNDRNANNGGGQQGNGQGAFNGGQQRGGGNPNPGGGGRQGNGGGFGGGGFGGGHGGGFGGHGHGGGRR